MDGAASGLAFGGKGDLKVNLSASGDNYLTTGPNGLAITKTGIEKIKTMLEAESTAALKRLLTILPMVSIQTQRRVARSKSPSPAH
ncbi:hypothetical protein CEQ31_026680 [Serratia odorifera]|uniref:hypothetical protein n=1 Tax=Serratia odorifera TaxID=618 RepID=UPI000B4E7AF8|nr:hypothetical protein [Serratia odorifera]PNK82410.1 hypothetical protein CEQ31_026680 [Serratia odorifera]